MSLREEGMTLIETLVTVLVLTVGLLVTLSVFTQMGRATYVAQRKAVLVSLAQREMERLRVLPYDQIGLTGPLPAYAPGRCRDDACADEELVHGGAIDPGGEPFEVQAVSGRIYRYVTWRAQPCPALSVNVAGDLSALGHALADTTAAVGDLCPGDRQTKRITIVVTSSEIVRFGGPVRLSTVAGDPDAGLLAAGGHDGLQVDVAPAVDTIEDGPPSPREIYEQVTAQQLYLTDTRCTEPSRVAPVAHHASHDTSSSNAACSGDNSRDLMVLAPITGLLTDPLPDLSQEVTRKAVGGRVLARDTRAGGCTEQLAYHPDETDRRKRSLHTWAMQVPSAAYETAETAGRATLTFWTQTADAGQLPGRLCIAVRREATGQVLGSADYTLPAWPAQPTQLAVSFDLAHTVIPAGERLLLTVRTPEDSGADLLLLYDHAGYQTALSVPTRTTRPILVGG